MPTALTDETIELVKATVPALEAHDPLASVAVAVHEERRSATHGRELLLQLRR